MNRTTSISIRLTQATVGIASITAMAGFVVLAIIRATYPYELDWLESGVVEQVRRLTEGQTLYTSPSIDFTSYPYPPLQPLLGAAVASVTGPSFAVLRLISIAATVATLVTLFIIVRSETGSRLAGITAAGTYAASYRLAGAWFDVGRADALFLLFTLGSLALVRSGKVGRYALAAGGAMALGLLAKQTAVFVALPLSAYLLITRPRFGLQYVATWLGFTTAVTLVLNLWTDGWYGYFVWELLLQHERISGPYSRMLADELLPWWPLAVVMILGAGSLASIGRWRLGMFGTVGAGLIAGAVSSRLHTGAYDNVLMPAFLAFALLLGLVVGSVSKARRPALKLGALGLCALQLAFLRYDPSAQLPTAADRRDGDRLIAYLREVPGDVLVVSHPTYAVMAGKGSHASRGATIDVLRGSNQAAKSTLTSSIDTALRERRFALIVLDTPYDDTGFPPGWQHDYQLIEPDVYRGSDTLKPVTSDTDRPSVFWLRRP